MGYELSIIRKNGKISKEEWLDYINSDDEFEAIDELSAELEDNKKLVISIPNAGLWKTEKGEVPFTYYEKTGEIIVKNPDLWIIEKMISIAKKLNAIVIGEEEEIYDDDFIIREKNKEKKKEKKWWKFW